VNQEIRCQSEILNGKEFRGVADELRKITVEGVTGIELKEKRIGLFGMSA
jgi:hypothetical protein